MIMVLLQYVLCVQRVLTTEFIHGCKISNLEAIRGMGLSVKDVSLCSLCNDDVVRTVMT